MALTTTYASLQTNVADWLNRTDIGDAIKVMIQNAEQKFKRDDRLRKLKDRGTFSISADGDALPSDFQSLDSWYHDGPTYFGEIEIVSGDAIGSLKRQLGDTGVPSHAALVDGVVKYAPEPEGSFDTKMIYWRTIAELSDSNTTNWLLLANPDIYLYGTLVESAPYLKDDSRMGIWKQELESRLEELHKATQMAQFSGTLRRQFRPIGG